MAQVFYKKNSSLAGDVIDYQIGNPDIDIIARTMNEFYPAEDKWAINTKCLEMVYIVAGGGKLITEDETREFGKGDVIVVPPGEKYRFEFKNAELIIVCNPPWTKEQHECVE